MSNQYPTVMRDDNSYYEETTFSPTTVMFPPEMSAYLDTHLNVPNGHLSHPSASTSGHFPAYLSGPPSLSPSSMPTHPHHSPRSSASPSSNFSISATDDFLLANSFSTNELDMFLFQNGDFPAQPEKPGHSLFLPQNRGMSGSFEADGNTYYPPNSAGAQTNFSQDESFDTLNGFSNASPASEKRRYSVISTESYPLPKMPYTNATNATSMAPTQPASYQPRTAAPQWIQQPMYPAGSNGWQPGSKPVQSNETMWTPAQNGG